MRRKQVVDALAVEVEAGVEVEDDLVVKNKRIDSQSMTLNNQIKIAQNFIFKQNEKC